jgi:hypothetical protein
MNMHIQIQISEFFKSTFNDFDYMSVVHGDHLLKQTCTGDINLHHGATGNNCILSAGTSIFINESKQCL